MYGRRMIWSNAVIAVGAIGCVTTSWSLADPDFSWSPNAFWFACGIGAATWLAYTWQRHVKSTRNDGLRTAHREWHRSHWPQLRLISIFLLPFAAFPSWMSLHGWNRETAIVAASLFLASVLTILYAGLPGQGGIRFALRRLPRLKLLWIGVVWALVTAGWPLWWSPGMQGLTPSEQWLLMSERGCIIMALTLPFDLRDIQWDPPSMRTIPQLVGPIGTRISALLLLGLACIARAALVAGDLTPLLWPVAMMGAVACARQDRPPAYFLMLDGLLIADAIWLSVR